MTEQIHGRLNAVRSRQRWQLGLKIGSLGLLIGSSLAILLAMARLLGMDLSPWVTIWLSLGGLGLGLAAGLLTGCSWKRAARAVDSHYRLKDRAATALEFLEANDPTILHRLQVADAIEHLDEMDPRQVAPLRMPRLVPYALSALALVLLCVIIPLATEEAEAALSAPLPEIVAEADRLEETMIEELERLTIQQPEEKLEPLLKELEELVDDMKEPGVDQPEALAKLSEMQAAIAAALAEYNLEAVDSHLKGLAEALSPAEAMQDATAALEEGNYDKAAEELENMDLSEMTRKEAKTVAGKLKKLAKQMEEGSQQELSGATTELCEGLECQNASKCKSGARCLAGLIRKQKLRKGIGMCLGCQLDRLAECKGACCKNGGNRIAKSDRPSNNWGLGASGKPFGDDATHLGGKRRLEKITGTAGDGPAEVEVTHSPEGPRQTARSYREMYQEYQKMSEAVLDSEPLPLGHRQTIRRYFELIRPQNDVESDES
ncbi:MAG: hypothetical protein ACYTG0_02565 [Planctomycetota bacterium]|jgi:hypothetical protein